MEHSRIKKRNVALIEKCVMSSIGIESLFRKFAGNPYKLHTYTSQESLNGVRQATDRLNNQWYINQSRTLSPTEREILRFMSRGYSMTQIAEQLKRNIKTIRAHKFNVMSKLGVSSDAGLLEAADILLCMRHCEASNVLHPY